MSKLKSILTKYIDYCIICGRQREEIHHILEGTARRQLSDADGLVIPLCSVHHNQSGMSVHQNKEMKTLCHIIGELAWEREYLAEICAESDGTTESWVEDAKTAFRKRYGQNFL